jgi:GT2 family glycosyltransferase
MTAEPTPKYSLIIPTFKRADEVEECLSSLCLQTYRNFEVIIADGTPGESLERVAAHFAGKLSLNFQYEEFIGVSEARNMGFLQARGEYIIFLDSDCIIPPAYLEAVDKHLQTHPLDLFGGPDASSEDFSVIQKAISYSMTSLITTGGIRGKKQHVGQYHPRSFNMGMRKEVFKAVNGFSEFKCGEDIELSIRILKAGYKVGLIEDAFVYHKRRTSFQQFFRQVYRFGAARVNIGSRHRGEIKLTHLFPLAFSSGLLAGILLIFFFRPLGIPILALYSLYFLVLVCHSALQNKSLEVGMYALVATLVQFSGYGYGFLKNFVTVFLFGKKEGISL